MQNLNFASFYRYVLAMIYKERTLPLKQIGEGFSTEGKIGGSVKIERFGSTLTVTISPFRLADLTKGTYCCLLTDTVHTIYMPLTGYHGTDELNIDDFCLLLYYKGDSVTPVAMATHGMRSYDVSSLLPTQVEPSTPYDDEAIADQNYYSNLKPFCDTYYQSVKSEIDETFESLPPFNGYKETLPSATFVRTGEVLLGKYYSGEKVRFLLFGARTREELPAQNRNDALFIPLSFFDRKNGYYILFQCGETGIILKKE